MAREDKIVDFEEISAPKKLVTCEFCGKELGNYNQHLSISHKDEWKKRVEEWVRLKDSGMSTRQIAEKFDANICTVSKHISKKKADTFYQMRRLISGV